ncbi:hypothetical protein PT277_09510 [Acetobacteraceae bacterium ESL0709]|nr:hypothetical protein [Acetobacteraceae bacterium ESL0697]MDF7678917.1 hypothetical protein [Acetobacteraceae bacterium ESL0709]
MTVKGHFAKYGLTLRILLAALLYACHPVSKAWAGQWYTGSLISASGGVTKGYWDIEPYYTYTQPIGYLDNRGHSRPSSHPLQRFFSNDTLWEYGLTRNLTIAWHTVVNYQWKSGQGHSHGPKAGDMPVDLIYRYLEPDPKRFIPSLNIYVGMVFPTGDYNRLGHLQDGMGNGNFTFRLGLTAQSTYSLPNGHELRLRFWNWFYRPVTSASLRDVTSYGTEMGFRGHGQQGMHGETGVALEYGITQRWVFAFDLYRDWANGAHVQGYDHYGHYSREVGLSSTSWQVAPALEYNWNDSWGVIFGSSFVFAGHNNDFSIAPQFAVNAMF